MRRLLQKVFNRQSSIIDRHSHRLVAAVTFFFVVGVACSQIRFEYSFSGLAMAGTFLICASLLALRRDRLVLSLVLGLAAISISGLLMAFAHRDGLSDSDVRFLLSRRFFPLNEPVSFEGCVIKDGEARGEDSIATIDLRAFLQKDHWIVCNGKGILSIAVGQAPVDGQAINLMRGDRIRGWATWRVPRNYENPGSADRAGLLARRGIFLVGRIKSSRLLETIPGGCANSWTKMASSVASRVRTSLKPIREKENGQPAAVLASLVIGDYSGLDNNTREIFQNAGTFHILVVSGLHVAWIAGVLLQLFKWMRLPGRIRYLLVNLAILFYTCVVGFQASITRCLWMFSLYLIGRMIFRRADTVNILLTSALILLVIRPHWLFETGFQLSFLSVLAIALTAVPVMRACVKPLWEPLRHAGNPNRIFLKAGIWHQSGRYLRVRWEMLIEQMTDSRSPFASRMVFIVSRCIAGAGLGITGIILTTISVQVWIEPLVAYYFNRMSWIASLAALVIVPFSSVVLASGIIGALAMDLPVCGPALMQIAGSLSSLLLSVTAFMTGIPGAWQRCPTPWPVFVCGGILLLSIWSLFEWRRFWIPCTFIVVMLACLSHGSVPGLAALFDKERLETLIGKEKIWGKNASILSLTFLDVGEGDSIVIHLPDNRLWVLDAGGLPVAALKTDSTYALDIGEAVVSRYLWHEWITGLDRLILSHTDLDHAGGIPAVMKNFKIARYDYSEACADATGDRILHLAAEKQIRTKPLHAGMEETAGAVVARVLNPPQNSRLTSTNENSLVLEFTFKHFSALLTADLEKTGDLEVLSQPGNLRGQLLKVAHHGSRSSTSEAFLDHTHTRWAVISVGRHNPFGHPAPEVLARLQRHGIRSFLTLNEGAITFETDGSRYAIRSYVNGILERGDLQ
jgi:competence protein ComEC